MTIPDFQSLMLPVLRLAAAGEQRISDSVEHLSKEFSLAPEERSELLPSGRQTTFANRVHWAKSYLGKAGLIEFTGRGRFQITRRGRDVLTCPPLRIDIPFLKQFPEFHGIRMPLRAGEDATTQSHVSVTMTLDERMRQARDQLEEELAQDLLDRVVKAPPVFFERLVVRLLISMGYGGSIADAGRALGGSGDGGVDGVIDEDALGLDRVYVQAKRYSPSSVVGPGDIRDFFGALDQYKAAKGLFVTTSSFSSAAVRTAQGLSKRIVLVDGRQLSQLMIGLRSDAGSKRHYTSSALMRNFLIRFENGMLIFFAHVYSRSTS